MRPFSPLWASCLAAFFTVNTGVAVAQSPPNPNATWPLQSFQSTDIQTPYLNVTKNGKTELGYLFFTPRGMNGGHSSIFEDNGQLVWQGPKGAIFAFEPQMLDGEPVLVYWDGVLNGTGYGYGSINILDNTYQRIHEVTLSGEDFKTSYEPRTFPSYISIHEGFITEKGSIIVTAVNVTQFDLESVGGPRDGWVMDSLIYEIDIKTNKVSFRWSALEHISEIPFDLSQKPLGGSGVSEKDPWNYFHLNSAAKYGDSYLVSFRYGCAAILIARDGTVTWQLNHEVRLASLSKDKAVFYAHNNENSDFTNMTETTTGLVLDLDLKAMTASLSRKLWNSQHPVASRAQGSFQNLPNKHVLLGHGVIPVIEEYDEHGALVMDARFGFDNTISTYRAYRHFWKGVPKTKPSVKACRDAETKEVVVFVSWNGATGVESWKLYKSPRRWWPKLVKTAPRNGFETIIRARDAGDRIVVKAVGGPNNGVQSEVITVDGGCN
ncbi:predicted protein [Uncinocarpus reesii 1704]|uniref:ASST-domain-containing protein n=1 Tax=Uncinocarpus reesii (strain UAMH 1704) TaxID=336963 RepID=C4JSU9_UNCRE|nr:uncharacterized protein UREG_05538 [Uncinocarpus reesii 1704]EEP80696.1 predicted protein [Uncinocarpus reesii 1704]